MSDKTKTCRVSKAPHECSLHGSDKIDRVICGGEWTRALLAEHQGAVLVAHTVRFHRQERCPAAGARIDPTATPIVR